ncbi:lytic polysaccharide monooxygenase [Streptomyces sp. NPDC020681]|uniref:lytic polysaccharide monooxygenase auxiliary activity family 9 protein n=1 Tax=Streptomyces sp. NPDC020681 TaxID=3365083 RepID=UPI0037BDCD2A
MTVRRTVTAAAIAGVVPLVLTIVTAGVAQAHGAPTDPVSRVAACGPEGAQRASAACGAAVAANGGETFDAWDNLRVADVRGRDRQVIPDGHLCSAGLDAYKGLDVARADWPATPLKAGRDFTLTYRSTIPHKGTFSLYLTKQGYDPAAPLRWDDLAAEPFAKATDPRLENGAYRIRGKLPTDLTGRHMLYTVWRNTDTPDTYYSCSDVDLGGDAQQPPADPPPADPPAADPAPAEPLPADPPAADPTADQPAEEQQQPVTQPPPVQGAGQQAAAAAESRDDSTTVLVGAGAAVLALLALGSALLFRPRRGRR